MNMVDFLFQRTATMPKDVILNQDMRISYQSLYKKIQEVSSLLHRQAKGEKILLIADNSPFFIISYFAIIKSGCVCVPIDPRAPSRFLAQIMELCSVKIAFCERKYAKKLEGHTLNRAYSEEILKEDRDSKSIFPSRGKDDDLALILFTSGSTDEPKGVMLSHKNVIANTKSIVAYLPLSEEDIMEVVLPFYYCYGASLLHTHVLVGGSLVLNNTFLFPNTVIEDILKYRCTGLAGVPSTYLILLNKSRLRETALRSLRYVTQAGGALAKKYILQLKEVLPGTKIYIMYGQTEATARLSYLPPELLGSKLGSVGRGIPGVTLKVVKENGEEVQPGEMGEIIALGENIMLGYYKDEEATRRTIRDGWLHTGDFATVDEEGYLYITHREKAIIKSGGRRISAKAIEEVIQDIPEVEHAAVIGTPDPLLGEAIKAFVIVKSGFSVTSKKVIEFCAKHLPTYMVPSEVQFVESFPTNYYGKVQYKELMNKHETS